MNDMPSNSMTSKTCFEESSYTPVGIYRFYNISTSTVQFFFDKPHFCTYYFQLIKSIYSILTCASLSCQLTVWARVELLGTVEKSEKDT
jgi:hypothetical protein